VKLEYLAPARDDLREIITYISEDNPVAARRILDRIHQSVSILADFPLIGHETEIAGLYKWSIPNLRYAAYYRIEGDTVAIAGVVHTSRKWPDALK